VGDEYALKPVIGAELPTRRVDERIAVLAGRQHGVVARRQLVALGLTRREIGHRLECGRLHLLHRGVYAVGHKVLSQEGKWMAAVFAYGPAAVLSHRSAAALWGLRPTGRSRIEVTTPDQLRPRPGLHPHRAVLPADELTIHNQIPTTTPARTLLDLAAVIPKHALDRALDEAEVLRLPGPATLLDRYPRRRGATNLRTLLLNARSPTPTRRELEARFLAFLDHHGFDRPTINSIIEGYEVDAVWREGRLIVELDGFATHGTRRAFERDRARDRRLTAAGWRVIRITWRQLDEPAGLVRELRQLRASRIDRE
jgi:very-short-patch-repair endonuclease/predicted transcriptional regulator of viral defense system